MSIMPLAKCDGCNRYVREWITVTYEEPTRPTVQAHVGEGDHDTIRCLELALSAYICGHLAKADR